MKPMNRKGVAVQESIRTLWQAGWSRRKIARELGINRETANKYVKIFENQPKVPTGSEEQNQPELPSGLIPDIRPQLTVKIGSKSRSKCESYRDIIEEKLEQGLEGIRIHYDLTMDHGFDGAYDSVKRFIKKLRADDSLPFRRIETPYGHELQVDYGTTYSVLNEKGNKRKTHILRVVLSGSRAAYCEAMYRQDTESFIRAIENAFRYFGGVTETVVVDNLKAAVIKADPYEPELNPKIISFAEHYNISILPTKPYTPEHKGKVESSVKYVKNNALKGRVFNSLQELNKFLLNWKRTVADTRIHGTTKQQVKVAFEKEKPFLKSLPEQLFPYFEEGERKVQRDGFIEIKGAYYSVPAEYLRRHVWVRYNKKFVRIFNQHMHLITTHIRVERGRFRSKDNHIPKEKRNRIEKGEDYLLKDIKIIGSDALKWSKNMLKVKSIEGLRTLPGLLDLCKKHHFDSVNKACKSANEAGQYRLKDIKKQLNMDEEQLTFQFQEKHELIRDLKEYKQYLN